MSPQPSAMTRCTANGYGDRDALHNIPGTGGGDHRHLGRHGRGATGAAARARRFAAGPEVVRGSTEAVRERRARRTQADAEDVAERRARRRRTDVLGEQHREQPRAWRCRRRAVDRRRVRGGDRTAAGPRRPRSPERPRHVLRLGDRRDRGPVDDSGDRQA